MTRLGDIFADQTQVSIFDPSLVWLNLPTPEFLRYAEAVDRRPFDFPLEDRSIFRDGATFLLSQAHRIWLTLNLVEKHLPDSPDAVLLDLGAFPFAIDIAVRHFLRRSCRIIATYAQPLSPESFAALAEDRIEVAPVNLDPRVRMDTDLPGLTEVLPFPDQSVDLVVFAHVIEHLYHPIQILREIFRVLKPSGKLVLTTDHAFLLGGFLNYLNGGEYVHEPVDSTAAMVFHHWRGHVRFFSEGDLRKLMSAAGGSVIASTLHEVYYDCIPESYFIKPNVHIPAWRKVLLTDFPEFRNEIMMVAGREGGPINPLDPQKNKAELSSLAAEFQQGHCRLDRSTLQDFTFAHRLLYGRWPTSQEIADYQSQPPERGLDGLLNQLVSSPEFAARPLAVQWERPGASCVVMTETPERLRFFFSAQDTFVGFPVAVGVFETEVCAALDSLIEPGMTCLDIGANFGFHSIRMAAALQGQGRVYSFEPDPFNYELLLRNCAENRMKTIVHPFPVACGDQDANVFLHKHPNPANFGGGFIRVGLDSDAESIPVCIRRVDGLVPQAEKISVIKMDVEGYELFALRGMREIVTASHPALVLEFHSMALNRNGPETAIQLLRELKDLGYSVFEATSFSGGEKKQFEFHAGADCILNLVCLHEGD